jgi:hypothetical protein
MIVPVVLLLGWFWSTILAIRTLMFGKGTVREDRLVVGALLFVFGLIICFGCGVFFVAHYMDPIPPKSPMLPTLFYAGYAAMITGLLSIASHRKTK